jgi:hypothetical protein
MLLHIVNDNEMMRKWVDFMKIKFNLNENI